LVRIWSNVGVRRRSRRRRRRRRRGF